jgi:dihydrofolate synthase/folylpolyglutamate synthase
MAGLTAHCYTSPHLIRFAERISIAGRHIDEETLTDVLRECEDANEGNAITLFEITTVAAFLAFSRQKADITLIETGLGGRFDSTNIFEKPALTIITPVSMDHTAWLGHTIADIAFEKAGILKSGVTGVIGPQQPDAHAVIAKRAKEVGAKIITHGKDWDFYDSDDGFLLKMSDLEITLPRPSLAGNHQTINAATAAITARVLPDISISNAAIIKGIQRTTWPGRLQKLTGRLATHLPKGWSLWLDGGHNTAAANTLATTALGWKDQPLHIIFGFLNSRDPKAFLQPLADFTKTLQAVAIPGEEASLTSASAAKAAREVGIVATEATDFIAAIDRIILSSDTPGRILICGSLYLAGAVLAYEEAPQKDGASISKIT